MNSLTIQIDKTGRQFLLDNNETIVLILQQDSACEYVVACVSFSPFGDTNTVLFADDWIQYATPENITSWGLITMNATQNVNRGNVYAFNNMGFSWHSNAYSNEVYGLLNQRNVNPASNITCGLGQKITVNNTEQYYPINVSSVPYNQVTYFTTSTKLLILAASGITPCMVIPTQALIGNMNRARLAVTLGCYLEIDLRSTSSVAFDSNTNSFKPAVPQPKEVYKQ